jgi:ABC-type dipeptide/oligopeptide/nickel transport system permease component
MLQVIIRIGESLGGLLFAFVLLTGAESIVAVDVARTQLGPKASETEVAALRHTLGVDQAFSVRLLKRVTDSFHGRFGVSYVFNQPVAPLILDASANTLRLVLPALLIGVFVGTAVGGFVAWSGNPLIRATLAFFSAIALLPSLIICTFYVYVFGYKLNWVSASYPAAVAILALVPTFILAHAVFHEFELALRGGYVRALRSYGFKEPVIALFVLKPAAISTAASFTNVVLYLVVSTLFVEITFSLPGIGNLLLNATQQLDYPILAGIVFCVVASLALMNMASAMVIYASDPRTR